MNEGIKKIRELMKKDEFFQNKLKTALGSQLARGSVMKCSHV